MVTVEDIAREAQVSPRTVARILSGQNKEVWLSTATRARQVRAIAERLGYRPNAAAKAMREGRFNTIALLTVPAPERGVVPNPLTDGIFAAMARHDLQLAVARLTREQVDDPAFVPKVVGQRVCDGLLLHFPAGTPARAERWVEDAGLPAVWLGANRPYDAVCAADEAAAADATAHLIAAGHRRIAYADYETGSAEPTSPTAVARRAGYLRAMRAAGLPPRLLCDLEALAVADDHQPTDFHGGRRLRYSVQWMAADDCPTAVVSYGHETAIPIMLACERTGRRFPDRFSLVTFGEVLYLTSLSCDTWVLPNSDMGAAAVDMLRQKIEQPGRPLPSRVLPYWYRAGHTIGRPREN